MQSFRLATTALGSGPVTDCVEKRDPRRNVT
jgi:hypothetical protein